MILIARQEVDALWSLDSFDRFEQFGQFWVSASCATFDSSSFLPRTRFSQCFHRRSLQPASPLRCYHLLRSSTRGLQLILQAVYADFLIRFRDGAASCGSRRSLIPFCSFSDILQSIPSICHASFPTFFHILLQGRVQAQPFPRGKHLYMNMLKRRSYARRLGMACFEISLP